VFHTSKGTAFGDTNLLYRVLKPAGRKIGASWIGWHTLRRTHATLLQAAGATLKDVQAQLGHTKLSTTNDIYIQAMPQHQRDAVEKLSELVTNGDEFGKRLAELPVPTTQIQ
jgi:integrase